MPGLTLTHREPWNVAGVDYPVGNITPVASMADPTTATLPSGCTYYSTGANIGGINYSGLGPEVYCNTATLSLHGYDFGHINGHNSVFLLIGASTTSSKIYDNHFENDANLTANISPLDADEPGLLYFSGVSSGTHNVYNNVAYGHFLDPCCEVPPIAGQTLRFVSVQNSIANVNITYNASFDFGQAHFLYNGNTSPTASNTVYMAFNYMEGWTARCPTGHGEVIYAGGGTSTYPQIGDYEFNTILQPDNVASCSTTAIYPSEPSASDIFSQITINGNTVIGGNLTGGATTPINTASGIVDNGTGSCPSSPGPAGNVLTVCSLGAGSVVGQGESTAIGGVSYNIYANVSGSGVGSQWNIENQANWTPVSISTTFSSISFTAQFSYAEAVAFDHGTIINSTISNNYIGWTSSASGGANAGPGGTAAFLANMDNSGSSCTNPTVFSGNIDLANGNALNAWQSNTGVGGC